MAVTIDERTISRDRSDIIITDSIGRVVTIEITYDRIAFSWLVEYGTTRIHCDTYGAAYKKAITMFKMT